MQPRAILTRLKTPQLVTLAILACLTAIVASRALANEEIIFVEGGFGRAEINVVSPALVSLVLGSTNGPHAKSILAQKGRFPWAQQGYSYVVGEDGVRYESRSAKPANVEVSRQDGRTALRMMGVKLVATGQFEPVAIEDWTFSAPGDGSQLVWHIKRQWQRNFVCAWSGSPGLFFAFDTTLTNNSVTSTIWYDPLRLIGRPSSVYGDVFRPWGYRPRALSKNLFQIAKDRDTWAIFKLWTDWHAPDDLRLEVEGGHLFRRGAFAMLGEAGAVTSRDDAQTFRKGQTEEVTLKIGAVAKQTTGYQLAVSLPDKSVEKTLKDFYGSLLNGGTINDQKGFDFGNESDGFYYSGSSWAQARAIAAGIPAAGALSSHPFNAANAFREHLAHIFSLVAEDGRDQFGFNHCGLYVDCGLMTILGANAYLLHSGDLAFVRQHLPTLERMLEFFIAGRNAAGLYELPPTGPHWYYDGVRTSGVNANYNAFFYKAALDLAEMEEAAGFAKKAAEYRKVAASIRKAFNKTLWRDNLPGGPRYLDWLDVSGKEVAYFCDLCQWPALAFGLASDKQARQLIATADARIAVLEKEMGYRGTASLGALWPIPKEFDETPWGTGYNGGHGLSPTYWEILARARYGDVAGATHRLNRFTQRAAETSWVGNWFNMKDGIEAREVYLADMVVVPAALVNGIMGIQPTWKRLEVTPRLPAEWPWAEAEVLYKGQRCRVTIRDGRAKVQPQERVIQTPLLWVMDANMQTLGPGRRATATNIDFGDGGSIELARTSGDRAVLGLWKFDEVDGPVRDVGSYRKHGALQGKGVERGQPGRDATSKSYRFEGKGWVSIGGDGGAAVGPYTPHNDSLTFSPWDSYTLQCWFKTESAQTQTMICNSHAYWLGLADGRLRAWIMQDGDQTKEARGSRSVAEGKWHHVAAVCDRATQRLSLYLDGKLDTADGAPTPENPADISMIRASKWPASVMVGGCRGGQFWSGWLDDVSIFAGALTPTTFAFEKEYLSASGEAAIVHVSSGSYQSPTYNWTQPAQLKELTLATDLNGGRVMATIETSDDDFKTVQARKQIAVQDGVNLYSLANVTDVSRAVRLRLDVARGVKPEVTPVVDAFRIRAEPANGGTK